MGKGQINAIDKGGSLRDVGGGFTDSAEFKSIHGTNPTNAQIIDRLYQNVLRRASGADGVNYWNNVPNSKAATVADVLVGFSESTENQVALIGAIQNGFEYTPNGV